LQKAEVSWQKKEKKKKEKKSSKKLENAETGSWGLRP